jgi:hypothetical protein
VFIVALAVGGALVTPVSAAQEEPFRRLAANEIRIKVIGRDLTDGIHWSWYFRPDGMLISVDMAKKRIGSWKIQDNQLCREKEKGQELKCHQVWMSGKTISLRLLDDMPELEGTVEPHRGP